MPNSAESPLVDLEELIGLFYTDDPTATQELGTFAQVPADKMSGAAEQLLNHNEHMTVTVEAFHDSEVDVRVLQELETNEHYSRKILLTRKSDNEVVQFGLVRLSMSTLPDSVQGKIREKSIPLGRILITHGVMRSVKLSNLFRITCGGELAEHFGVSVGSTCYGRTALMYCDGKPAIELLEIVKV